MPSGAAAWPDIFITRPRAAGARSARNFQARFGFAPILAPALEIVIEPGDLGEASYGAIAASSAAGIEALAQKTSDREAPLYVIGEASAAVARDLGFRKIHVAATPDVAALARLVIDAHPPSAGPVLYASGRDRRGDLVGALRAAGVAAETAILYRAEPCRSLEAAARARLQNLEAGAALIYSARAASAFAALLAREGLADVAPRLAAFCNAPATAEAAREAEKALNAPWARIAIAERPTENALFDLVAAAEG
ncbi:MAG: uroporphyrinogen-III synthase [Parvularculaceae bacterium]